MNKWFLFLLLFNFSFLFFNSSIAQPVIEWQKCLGGTGSDEANSVQQTSDGGYVVAGYSGSNDGDVTGNHGYWDFWIVRLDLNGNLQWQKSLGGSGNEFAFSVQQTSDGGFVVAGSSNSNDGDVTANHGGADFWIVKLDDSGNLQWQKCLGGTGYDIARSVQQTSDSGYIVAGSSTSINGDVTGSHGLEDYWVVKLDGNGNIQWQNCLGGSISDNAYSINQTYDGGYMVAGSTNSNNGDVTGNHGGFDYWVVKLDSSGNLQWQKCLGGSGNDIARSVQQTSDGGYLFAGDSNSNNGDVSGNHGGSDYWLVKLNGIGSILWQKSLGGTVSDQAYAVHQTSDNGCLIAGFSISNNGDVTGNHGGWDYWVVKLSPVVGIEEANSSSSSIIFPNPFSNTASISFDKQVHEATFTLYNLIGEVVTETSNINGESFQINRGTIPGGVYFYNVKDLPAGQAGEGKSIARGKVVVL